MNKKQERIEYWIKELDSFKGIELTPNNCKEIAELLTEQKMKLMCTHGEIKCLPVEDIEKMNNGIFKIQAEAIFKDIEQKRFKEVGEDYYDLIISEKNWKLLKKKWR